MTFNIIRVNILGKNRLISIISPAKKVTEINSITGAVDIYARKYFIKVKNRHLIQKKFILKFK